MDRSKAHIWIDCEDGCWTGLGYSPEGDSYLAAADSLPQLKQCINDSVEAEGWPGVVIYR